MREISRGALRLIGFHQPFKRPADRVGNHGEFRAALLLLENYYRLVQFWIAKLELLAKDADLRMLATEAQHSGSCNIRVIDVSGNQTAQIGRIVARAAAAAFVQKEANAIEMFE